MNTTRIGAIGAVLLLTVMLVPSGAALPAQANQHAVDQAHDRSDASPSETGDASNAADRPEDGPGEVHGPPVDMPSQVPGFVVQIHESIRSFLNGDISAEELTDSIRSATPDKETAAE